MSAEFKIGLDPVSDETADGKGKELLDNAKAQMGFVPNMYRTMANSPGYLSTYVHGYKAFRENSGFTPQEQEVVFLVLSRENNCDYCTAAHSMLADKVSKLDAGSLDAVRAGKAIADVKLNVLAEFARHVHDTRGMITRDSANTFLSAGYTEQQILEVVLAISVKILSNYSNHIFHTDVDEVFSPYKL
jgi:uncharacterized peroxidase-related enzyme